MSSGKDKKKKKEVSFNNDQPTIGIGYILIYLFLWDHIFVHRKAKDDFKKLVNEKRPKIE